MYAKSMNKKEGLSDYEKQKAEALLTSFDSSDRKYIQPIVAYVNEQWRGHDMDIHSLVNKETVDFTGMESRPFLLGLLSAFDNRYQACADKFFEEITWKQFFAIISINLCSGNPTINDLADVMGTSHQNVKQILLKLEKVGSVEMIRDEQDK